MNEMSILLTLDFSVLEWIQSHLRCGFGDIVMPLITRLGNGGVIWMVLAVGLILYPKTRALGMTVALSLTLEVICCNVVLKPLVGRIRPFNINTAVELLIPRPTDFSFPSGHTGSSFAAAAALRGSSRRLWIPAWILAALIAFSRLYLYVHYPTDILAGAILGCLTGWTAAGIVKPFGKGFMTTRHKKGN